MGGHPCRSTPSGTTGASTKSHPPPGAMSAPAFSHIPRHPPKQRPLRSSPDGGTMATKATCRDGCVPGSSPSGPASLVTTAQSSPAGRSLSSPAQGLSLPPRSRLPPNHSLLPWGPRGRRWPEPIASRRTGLCCPSFQATWVRDSYGTGDTSLALTSAGLEQNWAPRDPAFWNLPDPCPAAFPKGGRLEAVVRSQGP